MLTFTVEIFIDWLYTGKLPQKSKHWDAGNDDLGEYDGVQLAILKACALGDRLTAPVFRDSVQRVFVRRYTSQAPFYRGVIFAFANFPHDHVLLTMLVDTHCQEYATEDDTLLDGELAHRSQLPKEFLLRVMLRYSDLRKGKVNDELKPCDYHGHRSEVEREACQKQDIVEYESDDDLIDEEDK